MPLPLPSISAFADLSPDDKAGITPALRQRWDAERIPTNFGQAVDRGLMAAVGNLMGTGAGLVGMIPGPWQKPATRLKAYSNAVAEHNTDSLNQYNGPFLAQAAAQFPKHFLNFIPEILNPVNEVALPARAVTQFPRVANAVADYGPAVANAGYHFIRGMAQPGGVQAGAENAGFHLAGEGIEKLRPGGVAGNAIGAGLEALYQGTSPTDLNTMLDWTKQQMGLK